MLQYHSVNFPNTLSVVDDDDDDDDTTTTTAKTVWEHPQLAVLQ